MKAFKPKVRHRAAKLAKRCGLYKPLCWGGLLCLGYCEAAGPALHGLEHVILATGLWHRRELAPQEIWLVRHTLSPSNAATGIQVDLRLLGQGYLFTNPGKVGVCAGGFAARTHTAPDY
jgi:hypothetical protein